MQTDVIKLYEGREDLRYQPKSLPGSMCGRPDKRSAEEEWL